VKPRQLKHALEQKTKLLDKALAVYADVVNFDDVTWGAAALYRMAQVYDGFAESLRDAPAPKELPEADKQAYREELDSYVIEVEERAIQLASAGYQKAITMQVYNSYTKQLRESLGRLAADQYPPEREGRSGERYGDRPLKIKLVTEVDREQ
jgi:hypothetical protein